MQAPLQPLARAGMVMGLALAAAACGPSGGDRTAATPPAESAAKPAAVDPAVASLPAPYNTADIDRGKALFSQCRSCHTIDDGGANMTGPNLYGLFGRRAGSRPDFKYSDAVRTAGFTWDAEHLDSWLKAPRDYLKGAKMSFAGLPEEKDRIDVIAYLKTQTGDRK